MNILNYRKRLIESQIKKKMSYSGGIIIEGAKWVGKSTTAGIFSNTFIKLQDPLIKKQYQILATISKDEVLKGEKPILFDEWQEVPEIWDFIRLDIDDNNYKGAYLLTGSTKKQNLKTSHTGTGRINSIYMRPMSLYESGESNGLISLKELFSKPKVIPVMSDITIDDILHYICRGGWPGSLDLSKDMQLEVPKDLLESIIRKDIDEVDGIVKDKEKLRKIVKSYARNISTLAANSTIYKDQTYDVVLNPKTFGTYMNSLKRLYIVEDILPWSQNIRSSARLRKGSKRQFVDPSIAVAALGLSPDKLKKDFETFGFLFESIATRDIRVYAEEIEGTVYYYSDTTGLEIDLIVELNDGRWGGIEVKLGENEVDKASQKVATLAKEFAVKPSTILREGDTAGVKQRRDVGYVIPLGSVRP